MERAHTHILVTGGAGFIGSHTAVALTEAGYTLVIVDNLVNSDASVLDRIKTITGRRPGDIAASYADPSLARRLLNWRTTRDLDAMCADAWRFVGSSSKDGVRS